jgi:3-hydroxyisobutyrate dehydrogenase-like beta-hydroxyacid dehydrogenase
MTMMMSGDTEAFARVRTLLDRIAGRVFMFGPRPGDASTFKIVNNMLAAANLAAGAEAQAIAQAAGLDLQHVCDVVNASSGASWIFADRVGRALAGDYVPRAAAPVPKMWGRRRHRSAVDAFTRSRRRRLPRR